MARASNPAGTTAMWVRDRLDGLWSDEDFAGRYPRDGRPGISPAQLATVSVLQFLLELSDRDAAEAVRCRIDFKYALGLELDDPGFHHSVPGDFRDRLLEEGRADRLPGLALARLKECSSAQYRSFWARTSQMSQKRTRCLAWRKYAGWRESASKEDRACWKRSASGTWPRESILSSPGRRLAGFGLGAGGSSAGRRW
jgi:transposase